MRHLRESTYGRKCWKGICQGLVPWWSGCTLSFLNLPSPHQHNEMSLRSADDAKGGGVSSAENHHCYTEGTALGMTVWIWASPSTWGSTVHISALKQILSAGNDKGDKDLGAVAWGKSAVLADYGTSESTPSSTTVSPPGGEGTEKQGCCVLCKGECSQEILQRQVLEWSVGWGIWKWEAKMAHSLL